MSATRDIHVGTPAANYQLKDSVTIHFHNFENLTAVKDEMVESPTFLCAGSEWSLLIYPGGNEEAAEGMVSVFLFNESSAEIDAWFEISIIKNNGGIFKIQRWRCDNEEDTFGPGGSSGASWGWKDFISRNDILKKSNNILDEGTLTFDVRIKPNKEHYSLQVKPQSQLTLGENISKLFGDSNTADLLFSVGKNMFYVHKLILKTQAPELFELSEQFSADNPMVIKDVDTEIFEMMLKHVYGIEIHACDWKKHSKQILVASGKYGLTTLKTEAEAWHVKNLNLTVDNAVDELLYADATHCLDLKKASIQFIVENSEGVLASASYAKLYESPELMKYVMMQLAKSHSNQKRKLDELSPSSWWWCFSIVVSRKSWGSISICFLCKAVRISGANETCHDGIGEVPFKPKTKARWTHTL